MDKIKRAAEVVRPGLPFVVLYSTDDFRNSASTHGPFPTVEEAEGWAMGKKTMDGYTGRFIITQIKARE
jgi:hypothetical protein